MCVCIFICVYNFNQNQFVIILYNNELYHKFVLVIYFRMPYMEALVLESVRMFMGRTFSIPHRALQDTTLQGYFIPKVFYM